MEYIDGMTLADLLRDRGPLGLQEAREIAAQFLAASKRFTARAWCIATSSRKT